MECWNNGILGIIIFPASTSKQHSNTPLFRRIENMEDNINTK